MWNPLWHRQRSIRRLPLLCAGKSNLWLKLLDVFGTGRVSGQVCNAFSVSRGDAATTDPKNPWGVLWVLCHPQEFSIWSSRYLRKRFFNSWSLGAVWFFRLCSVLGVLLGFLALPVPFGPFWFLWVLLCSVWFSFVLRSGFLVLFGSFGFLWFFGLLGFFGSFGFLGFSWFRGVSQVFVVLPLFISLL